MRCLIVQMLVNNWLMVVLSYYSNAGGDNLDLRLFSKEESGNFPRVSTL
jgi:hypothetical protein